MQRLKCPDCAGDLVPEQHHGIEIDVCLACQGMWFDRGELESYWQATRQGTEPLPFDPNRVEADAPAAASDCPRCSTTTIAVQRVDVFQGGRCSNCSGVWLAPSQIPPTRGKGLLDRGDWMILDAIESAVGLVTDFLGIP